jgi:hypothetical protein
MFSKVLKSLKLDPKSRLTRRIRSKEDAKLTLDTIYEEISERKRLAYELKQKTTFVKISDKKTALRIIDDSGKVIANLYLENQENGNWFVSRLWVGSYFNKNLNYRRLGIGKIILDLAREYLKEQGAKVIMFNAKKYLLEFYESLGAIKDPSRKNTVFGSVPMYIKLN